MMTSACEPTALNGDAPEDVSAARLTAADPRQQDSPSD
jgi:hypothetical protein